MCRECHDLAPNTAIPAIFFEWACSQSFYKREADKINEALRAYGIFEKRCEELRSVIESAEFRAWTSGKVGLHWPQSNYGSASSRLTPATLVGLAVHYLKAESSGHV
jgi:hypothetical protein